MFKHTLEHVIRTTTFRVVPYCNGWDTSSLTGVRNFTVNLVNRTLIVGIDFSKCFTGRSDFSRYDAEYLERNIEDFYKLEISDFYLVDRFTNWARFNKPNYDRIALLVHLRKSYLFHAKCHKSNAYSIVFDNLKKAEEQLV